MSILAMWAGFWSGQTNLGPKQWRRQARANSQIANKFIREAAANKHGVDPQTMRLPQGLTVQANKSDAQCDIFSLSGQLTL
jgi:hypothetical protein